MMVVFEHGVIAHDVPLGGNPFNQVVFNQHIENLVNGSRGDIGMYFLNITDDAFGSGMVV